MPTLVEGCAHHDARIAKAVIAVVLLVSLALGQWARRGCAGPACQRRTLPRFGLRRSVTLRPVISRGPEGRTLPGLRMRRPAWQAGCRDLSGRALPPAALPVPIVEARYVSLHVLVHGRSHDER
jgi:hypothetical protein